jgi:hypothetical protein
MQYLRLPWQVRHTVDNTSKYVDIIDLVSLSVPFFGAYLVLTLPKKVYIDIVPLQRY